MISARLHFEDVLAAARRLRASDVHIHAGEAIRFRLDGALMPIDDEEFSQNEIDELLADFARRRHGGPRDDRP